LHGLPIKKNSLKKGDHSVRLLICAGGTGGGVYPALTVLQELGNEADPVLWVGGDNGMEAELVRRQNIPFASIPAAGVHGVGSRALPGNLVKLARGTLASRRILREFRPDVLLFTGGYVAVPMAVMGIPLNSLLYVPDIEPGLALRTLARYSDCIAVTAEDSQKYFSKKKRIVVTGYPTRAELSSWTREKGLQTLGLSSDIPVLLIFGGSKGSRSINQAVVKILEPLLSRAQVIHVSGQLDWNEVLAAKLKLPEPLRKQYYPFPYLHEEMGAALAVADLAICRAGASTLGELPLVGLPAILVPYPFAWRYQKVNADYLVKHGAAKLLGNAQLCDRLLPMILELLDNTAQLGQMGVAMRALSRPDAAQQIAGLLRELAHSAPQKGRLTTW
jgi:undecaprenyldiphospho-muramoylpentapeptide beta-N-acetylglucosaminyltransferase